MRERYKTIIGVRCCAKIVELKNTTHQPFPTDLQTEIPSSPLGSKQEMYACFQLVSLNPHRKPHHHTLSIPLLCGSSYYDTHFPARGVIINVYSLDPRSAYPSDPALPKMECVQTSLGVWLKCRFSFTGSAGYIPRGASAVGPWTICTEGGLQSVSLNPALYMPTTQSPH